MRPDLRRMSEFLAPVAAILSLFLTYPPAAARTFGDDALTSPRLIVDEKQGLYSAVGTVECRSVDGQVRRSNGFLLGSRTTMIASREALGEGTSTFSGDVCTANFYAADGTLSDSVAINRVIALDGGRSPSNGLALLSLKRPSLYARAPLTFLHDTDPAKLDRRPITMVTMVAWQGGLRKIRSGGIAYQLGPDVARPRGAPGRVVMATDYDSVSASRGSPVFDGSGNLVGVHSGSYCPANGSAFDKRECFNEFVTIGDAERNRITAALR